MHIHQIQITALTYAGAVNLHRATFLLETDDGTVSLVAQTDSGPDTPEDEITRGLIRDAVRQIGRLSEYRCVVKQITLGDCILTDPPPPAS